MGVGVRAKDCAVHLLPAGVPKSKKGESLTQATLLGSSSLTPGLHGQEGKITV